MKQGTGLPSLLTEWLFLSSEDKREVLAQDTKSNPVLQDRMNNQVTLLTS